MTVRDRKFVEKDNIYIYNSVDDLPSASEFGFGVAQVGGLLFAYGAGRGKNRGLYKPGRTIGGSLLNTNATWTNKFALPCANYNAIRIGFLNQHTADVVGCKFVVAPTDNALTDTAVNRQSPVLNDVVDNTLDSTTEITGWRSVKFGGVSSVTTPATLAAATDANTPSIKWSDWLDMSSLPRADGADKSLILIRGYYPGATYNYKLSGCHNNMAVESAANRGYFIQGVWNNNVDYVATLSSTGSTLYTGFIIPCIIEFMTDSSDVFTVGSIGDSTLENFALVTDITSDVVSRACWDLGVSHLKMSISGVSVATYLASAQSVMTNVKPDALIFEPWSPNTPPALTNEADAALKLNTAKNRTYEFLRYCETYKIVPILTTPIPKDYAEALDTYRRQFATWLRGLGHIVADYDVKLSDGATPAQIITAYKYDSTHPNEAGIEYCVPEFRNAISKAKALILR